MTFPMVSCSMLSSDLRMGVGAGVSSCAMLVCDAAAWCVGGGGGMAWFIGGGVV